MIQQDFSLKKIEDYGRLFIPHMLLLILFILNITALPSLIPGYSLKPQFVLMAVYYWAIFRPTLLPPSFCFLLGLLMDMLTGMTPGVLALVFVITHWIARDQRRFLMGQPYLTNLAVFGVLASLSTIMQWGLYGLAHMRWDDLLPSMSSALASTLLFPFVTLLLVFTHRMLPVASRP